MIYTIYKFAFLNGVHFGKNSLEDTEYTFMADTFFSALMQEAIKVEKGDELLQMVKKNELIFSDAFPYMGDTFYLPKPMIHLDLGEDKGDSTQKKKYKKLKYVPVDLYENYLRGDFPIEERANDISKLGQAMVKVSASIRGEEETKPYRVGIFRFHEGCGVYVIVGAREKEIYNQFERILDSLSLSGIGGKRNSGLGRFEYYKPKKIPELFGKALVCGSDEKKCNSKQRLMSLSVSLPLESEMDSVIEGASYTLIKRSGFVASETYAPVHLRKRDFYVFQSGACFDQSFMGDVYDVSAGGAHAVYRYAKPLFLEVNV